MVFHTFFFVFHDRECFSPIFTVVFVFISKLLESDVCASTHWAMTRQEHQIYCPSYSFNYATVRMLLVCMCLYEKNNHFWLRPLFTFAHSWQKGSFDGWAVCRIQAENTSTGYWSLSSVQLPFCSSCFSLASLNLPFSARFTLVRFADCTALSILLKTRCNI